MKMKPKMKVGDLVRLGSKAVDNLAPEERDQMRWIGIILDTVADDGICGGVVVYWSREHPRTLEYIRHLEVVR